MHWTYEPVDAQEDLEQGDIIAPLSSLRAVLGKIHPHFDDDKYLSFMVATQSCDLVRRKKGAAKARYVSIAAVRSLKSILPGLLADVVRPVAPGVFPKNSQELARQFLKRLFDQNEQALGLFYLHPDADVGLGEPSVAVLRVKVALKAEHYDELAGARRGRLSAEFRGKFGWLLGNLYSRAASPDWSDTEGGDKQVTALIDAHLREQIPGFGPIWIDDELIEIGKASHVSFELPHADLLAKLEELRPKPKIERMIDAVMEDAQKTFNADAKLKKMRERLDTELDYLKEVVGNDEKFQELRTRFEAVLGDAQQLFDDATFTKLRNRLANNGRIKRLLK